MKEFLDCKNKDLPRKTERGKTFVIQAVQDFTCEIVDIENCLFKDAPFKKCDWLFLIPKDKDQNKTLLIDGPLAFYVELKGIDLNDACEQLYNSIDKTKTQIPSFNIEARIVSIKGFQPELQNVSFYKKVKKLIKKDIVVCKVHKGNSYTHVERIN